MSKGVKGFKPKSSLLNCNSENGKNATLRLPIIKQIKSSKNTAF